MVQAENSRLRVIDNQPASRNAILAESANELIFAVVGHVGSGTSEVAETIIRILGESGYQCTLIKAREQITQWAQDNHEELPEIPIDGEKPPISVDRRLQDLGDKMRESGDHAIVARYMISRIRTARAEQQGIDVPDDGPVVPDGQPRAYVLDSVRHPAEVELLRRLYQHALTVVGVVCHEEVRIKRLTRKYCDGGEENAKRFMERDAESDRNFGQKVAKAFHLADFFVDNSEDRRLQNGAENKAWNIPDKLSRLRKIITHEGVLRPTLEETAMYLAYGAQMRSACLSRQVGAAIMGSTGDVLATGTNEVPKPGGGSYGDEFGDIFEHDERCAFRSDLADDEEPYCSNTREQNRIIDLVIDSIPELKNVNDRVRIQKMLREGPIGGLLEFSRAVHAEMDALLSAGSKGVSVRGSRMFVTTYPCHYCARHIVSAGIDEVQYIEPYPKSQATTLHGDAIMTQLGEWEPPSKGGNAVLFRPFVGVAPRMYSRAFLKDRELKDGTTGTMKINAPPWGPAFDQVRISYADLEAKLKNLEARHG